MSVDSVPEARTTTDAPQQSLSTAAARNLATTTKSAPQMQEITSRWLLRMLPWVEVEGGAYRVNRRLRHTVGDGRIEFVQEGAAVRVIPRKLGELALLRGFEDTGILTALADRCAQRDFAAGDVLVERGSTADRIHLIAHGRVSRTTEGKYGGEDTLAVLAGGEHFGAHALTDSAAHHDCTVTAETSGTLLTLSRADFLAVQASAPRLQAHIDAVGCRQRRRQNKHGEAEIAVSAGHVGEPELPGAFVDYEPAPREYELSVAQTVLRIHTRVADLYNGPMDQSEEQLRLSVEALRERQEHELVNNREFGLLHSADFKQRIQPRLGPPTPDDMDDLLCRRRGTKLFLAHPRTIAAIGRGLNACGLRPDQVEVDGHSVPAWRGVPILPCDKIPISREQTSSIIAMRTGEKNQGVIGLRRTGLQDEYEPGLSVRFMGINEQAVISYLVSTYFSAAVLLPDAVGVLENVLIAPGPR
ncbi:family 2B encapsulin nanocompartment shell protein [Streptomyces stelliscabiei]|uniref:family 2B encapsulin nanocompartment shell protein n=1 Tax=Streptomyces stelliscabiei TaxID=146820 RepID=UPI0029B61EF7|nr:family 2B encapsulin nanocompartment shell protein [Streptomyces stelliscabiei]MDX2550527.1 family 2B encapsulin nanocompartment shell protein [Streptomyces stelliscabiei]MDX2610225.1 family 2B encapsulin nanocompartment shell protein [Streptomyces stelliscabiei]MDX2634854.1 family 2B encapsulin nanocompartment shell protein [Streptomyces stelliscabiei]MDX2659800.1 family 2B encapsulin nanocompartment shell protein [Streptomyces stelliscabiei]MDX2711507.1 family 2B encapsulin nanocompartmen